MIESVAYHEAGHAIMCLQVGLKFNNVTVMPKEESLGNVKLSKINIANHRLSDRRFRSEAEKYIQVALSGPITEQLFSQNDNYILGSSNDFQQCFSVALSIFGPIEVAEAYVNFLATHTKSVFLITSDEKPEFTERWDEVKILSQALIDRKILRYKEVLSILTNYSYLL